jgi:hypothetical protein
MMLAVGRVAVVLIAFVAALWIAWPLMPDSTGHVGHDYKSYVPYLLAGQQWIAHNGWFAPPYITPA